MVFYEALRREAIQTIENITIEEKTVRLHASKRDLADSLLEGTDQSARLSTVDLLNLSEV